MNLRKTQISVMLFVTLCFAVSCASAQDTVKQKANIDFCSKTDFSLAGNLTVKEMREITVDAPNLLSVDGQEHGSIIIKGENRSDVLIRACILAAGVTKDEARAFAKNIRVETEPVIKVGSSQSERWLVSYEIYVPIQTNLKLNAYHGGIEITNVEGAINLNTMYGYLSLYDVGGNVRGRTEYGLLTVVLSGNSWKGAGLDLITTHGNIQLSIPENYAANLKTGTVYGSFKSDVKSLQAEKNDGQQATILNKPLNGGGAPVHILTSYGGVCVNFSGVCINSF